MVLLFGIMYKLEGLVQGELEDLGFCVVWFFDWCCQVEVQWVQCGDLGQVDVYGIGEVVGFDVVVVGGGFGWVVGIEGVIYVLEQYGM